MLALVLERWRGRVLWWGLVFGTFSPGTRFVFELVAKVFERLLEEVVAAQRRRGHVTGDVRTGQVLEVLAPQPVEVGKGGGDIGGAI